MKKITILAALAAMVATSCHRDESVAPGSTDQDFDGAYVSLSIVSPTSRADGDTKPGAGDENKIFSLALLSFDANYDYIGASPAYVAADKTFKCEVAPDARRFFAVVNPTQAIWDAINAVASFNQEAFSKLPAVAMDAKDVSTENFQTGKEETRGFTMVNAGVMNANGILLESLVSVNNELSKDPDLPTPIEIKVDRLVAKFEYSVNANFDTNTSTKFGEKTDAGVGKVLGVALTATNKATNLYSMITKNDLTNNNVYRTDHNMAVGQAMTEAENIIDALNENFNWLQNDDETTDNKFIAPNATAGVVAATPEYVLENTCLPLYSNSNNLTQAIVKAQYNPLMTNNSVLPLGTSWFKMLTSDGTGTLYLTFDEVKALYKGEYAGFTASTEAKASMDVQLHNIMGRTDCTWADDEITLDILDKRPYGGYRAATVDAQSDYVLQYYQKAVNYFDIFIQHDEAQLVSHIGRWGMVRNNSYTMDVSGIMQEGLPYIPDPTDPEIVDPENQKPEDPEPADKKNAHIAVSIDVNDWVIWTQTSPLL